MEDAAGEAGAEGFGAGFLGGEAFGVCAGVEGLRAACGAGAFGFSKNALHETVPKALKHFLNPPDIAEIRPEPNNHVMRLIRKSFLVLFFKKELLTFFTHDPAPPA
jgi:hypothetical protein